MKFLQKKVHFCPMNEIIKLITDWYIANKRDLPWRRTNNPYNIWVSEIILQQTRVEQGLPYYIKFIESFPDVESLSNASSEEVLSVWKGLGYYRRALNMHQAAKIVMAEFKGNFPSDYNELLKLKGVGEYTAAAIASMAYGEKTPVVDGNVIRVLSRLLMLKDKNNKAFKRKLVEIIGPSMEIAYPGVVNQALMEYGAMVCVPQNPHCTECVLHSKCKAYIDKCVDEYPLVSPKAVQKTLYFNYLYISDGESLIMHLRSDEDIWKKMYELPLIQTDHLLNFNELSDKKVYHKFHLKNASYSGESKEFKHILSHRIIYAKCFIFKSDRLEKSDYEIIRLLDLEKKPMPRLIENVINECKF